MPARNPYKPKNSSSNPDSQETEKKDSKALKNHKNPIVRGFAKFGYSVWLIFMVVGLSIAFIISLFVL